MVIVLLVIVLQGQRACGGFFKACLAKAAFQLVLAVQLDLHIAASLNAQGSLSCFKIVLCSGVAHIDLHVFQGEFQRRGSLVDHRNDVVTKAICRGRGCRVVGSSQGCLLGLGLLPGVLLPVSVLRLVSVFLRLVVLRLLSVLLVVVLRLLSALLLVVVLRLLSILLLVVFLYHRAKAGVLCCGAFQVALQRGGGLFMGGDDDLLIGPNILCLFVALFDGLAILIFGDGNVAVVDIIVGLCKGRSRQRHRDAQRCHQSCCPAECVVLPHRSDFLSFSTFSCAFCTSLLRVFLVFYYTPPPPSYLQ